MHVLLVSKHGWFFSFSCQSTHTPELLFRAASNVMIPFSFYANASMPLSIPLSFYANLIVVYMQPACHIFWSLHAWCSCFMLAQVAYFDPSICVAPVLSTCNLLVTYFDLFMHEQPVLSSFAIVSYLIFDQSHYPCMSVLCWAAFAIVSYLICDWSHYPCMSTLFFASLATNSCSCVILRPLLPLPLFGFMFRLSVDHIDFCHMRIHQCTTPFHVLATPYSMLGRSRLFFFKLTWSVWLFSHFSIG